jgi:peptide/nickel transport system substrate-binding protein
MLEFDSVSARAITMPFIPAGGTGYVNGVEVKAGNDVTSDVAIRRALSYGIDRQALIDLALHGHGEKAFSLNDKLPWFNEKTIIKDGDIEGAKKILADGGWTDTDKDGIVEKNGLKAEFNLYYSVDDQIRQNCAIAAADLALDLGIKINLIGAGWDEIFDQGRANAILWMSGRPYPSQLFDIYSAKMINQGYNNIAGYSNPVVQGYLDKALAANTQEEANEYFKLAQWDGTTGYSALGDEPVIWLARPTGLFLVKEKLDVGEDRTLVGPWEWALFTNLPDWKWKQ